MAKPMKMPNGYGSVIKLSGRRRNPFAVRITEGKSKKEDGKYHQTYKYLAYFEKRADALAYLADYNRGLPVPEHKSLINAPTFKEVYDEWLEFKTSRKKNPSQSTVRNYNTAVKHFENLWDKPLIQVTTKDLQAVADSVRDKGPSSVNIIKSVTAGVFGYAMDHDIIGKNPFTPVFWEYEEKRAFFHKDFSEEEIKELGKHLDDIMVRYIIIMIYTGLRPIEFIELKKNEINLEEGYIQAGRKTEAGTNRIIPIHSAIYDMVKDLCDTEKPYVVETMRGTRMSYQNFLTKYWAEKMKELGFKHMPHDTRHTFATLCYRYELDELKKKLIIGHAVKDLTEKVYTHITVQELKDEIEKIPVIYR